MKKSRQRRNLRLISSRKAVRAGKEPVFRCKREPDRVVERLYHCITRSPVISLARLSAAKNATFEFRLEPIVQFTAWSFAAFEIDFVCAPPDFLGTHSVPY